MEREPAGDSEPRAWQASPFRQNGRWKASGSAVRNWLQHAFAVEKAETVEPTPAQAALVDRVCREVVRRRLTTPALVALEMSRPLNFVTAQAIHFFEPMLRTFGDVHAPRDFANFLEHRGSIDHLAKRLEAMEAEAMRRDSDDESSRQDDA